MQKIKNYLTYHGAQTEPTSTEIFSGGEYIIRTSNLNSSTSFEQTNNVTQVHFFHEVITVPCTVKTIHLQ